MKVIVAGSREGYPSLKVCTALSLNLSRSDGRCLATEIVSGACRGVDADGEAWAETYDVPVKQFPPDESKRAERGNGIYHDRNRAMAEYADACMVFQVGGSKGSESMIREAKRAGIPLVLFWRAEA